jgi:hypothetical protein
VLVGGLKATDAGNLLGGSAGPHCYLSWHEEASLVSRRRENQRLVSPERLGQIVRENYPHGYEPIILGGEEFYQWSGVLEWRRAASGLSNLISVKSGAIIASSVRISRDDSEHLLSFAGNPLDGFLPLAHFLYWDLRKAAGKTGKARQLALKRAIELAGLALCCPEQLPEWRAEGFEDRIDREEHRGERMFAANAGSPGTGGRRKGRFG